MESVKASVLFQSLCSEHPQVEIWSDKDFAEGGGTYFWIVSRIDGAVQNLAYVRIVSGILQRRTYDKNGDDLWVETQ